MNSILLEIKQSIGLSEQETIFDSDIIMYINSAFLNLFQLGVGPSIGFYISDKTKTWNEFTTDLNILGYIKTYIFIKTKLLFDPPQTSFVLEALERQIQQIEWRLNVQAEGETL